MSAVPSAAAIPIIARMSSVPPTFVIVAIIIAMPLTVIRNIIIVIPAILYKIDGVIAGVVATAIAPPVFSVARRNP